MTYDFHIYIPFTPDFWKGFGAAFYVFIGFYLAFGFFGYKSWWFTPLMFVAWPIVAPLTWLIGYLISR